MTRRTVSALLAITACRPDQTRTVAAVPSIVVEAELALQVSDGVAIWFTGARPDTAADGTTCLERVMEIRAGVRTLPIPLLYTGEVPTLINDSTIEVHLWRHCAPADLYRVHLRTGQPTRAGI